MTLLKKYSHVFFELLVTAIVYLFYGLLRIIGLRGARLFLGAITSTLGPLIPKSKRAYRNLEKIFPQNSPAKNQIIVQGMWQNLGYVVAEYAHLEKIQLLNNPAIRVEGLEHLLALKDDGKPGLIFTGHLGNWELVSLLCAQAEVPTAQVYRAANIPLVNRLIRRLQSASGSTLIPRGPEGGRKSIEALRSGQHLILLVDQKMNNGISVPFFGHEAMTAPGLARLAERFDCPVLPVQVAREGMGGFVITCHPPLYFDPAIKENPQRAFMMQVHAYLESWITQHPEQWLWLHNRWPW
jgi:KDO2-lipid IV(A) lauroyltransferase